MSTKNSQTKYSEECWGGEDGKQLDEYKKCLRSISKQLKYLQEQHKLNKAEEERKAKEAQKAQEEQEASASAGRSAEENAVEVPGMITSSPTAASSSDAGGKAASLITASSSGASSAVGGGTSSSGSLFSELTEKGLFIFRRVAGNYLCRCRVWHYGCGCRRLFRRDKLALVIGYHNGVNGYFFSIFDYQLYGGCRGYQ